ERRGFFGELIPEGGAVAAGVGAAPESAAGRIERDAVGVTGELAPVFPAIDRVTATGEPGDRVRGKAPLHVEQVARVTEGEAAGQPARRLDSLLDVETEVDHGRV